MNKPQYPSTTQWQQLYDLADELKQLAPWQWMDELDLFGVKDPDTGEVGFVSIMGVLGEHLAVAFYAGFAALDRFWEMQDLGEELTPDFLLNTPQLQLSFEDRQTLEKYDLQVVKSLGRKYRGSNAWPQFRSLRAGYTPWRLLADEARYLIHALPQVMEVARRFYTNPDLLEGEGEEEVYLVRVPEQVGEEWQWRDEWWPFETPDLETLPIKLDEKTISKVGKLPPRRSTVEMEFFWLPAVVQEYPDDRPRFAYMLLAVDSHSGMVLGNEMLSVETTFADMLADMPNLMAQMLLNLGYRPETILVSDPLLYEMVGLLPASPQFSLELVDELPMLDQARAFLMDRFR